MFYLEKGGKGKKKNKGLEKKAQQKSENLHHR